MAERLFASSVLIACLVLMLLGLFYFEYPWKLLRFPFGIGAAIILLCIADLVLNGRQVQPRAVVGAEPVDTQGEARLAPREAVRGTLWVLVALPTVYLLGYVIGLPLYILFVVKMRGHSWPVSLGMAAGGLAVLYLGFVLGLGVPLPLLPFDF